MIKPIAINLIKPEPMMVTWDLGRRCNFDCTYCEASRHNNYSKHADLDSMLSTFDFIKRWTEIYNSKRKYHLTTNLDFTGGEPTVNPKFWDLVKEIKSIDKTFGLGLTSNGAWPKKDISKIVDNMKGVTISWHAEVDKKIKKRVLENILNLKKNNIWLQVNVMLHCDYFDEAIQVCDFLEEHNIKFNPVPIGDGTIGRSGWFIDKDGKSRRTSHTYNESQQSWFFKKLKISPETASVYKEGTDLGRKCCGGRCLTGKIDDQWQNITLIENKFKNWNCMVDWYFLHIDQESGLIYHHQTCQALYDQKKGALGHLSDKEKLLEDLKIRLERPNNIICPNDRCGCGMCVPKAKNKDDFIDLWNIHVKY
jgi:MoaA/NifB/PqqE/SkfB family radical SAM enzyme